MLVYQVYKLLVYAFEQEFEEDQDQWSLFSQNIDFSLNKKDFLE